MSAEEGCTILHCASSGGSRLAPDPSLGCLGGGPVARSGPLAGLEISQSSEESEVDIIVKSAAS